MFPYRNTRATTIAIVVFFALVAGYAYFEAQSLIYGPRLELNTPNEVVTVDAPLLVIRGSAQNIIEVRLNGLPIVVTEAGVFEEPYLLAPGYNTVTLSAIDKLGRETTRVLKVVYTAPEEPTESLEPLTATSTNQ